MSVRHIHASPGEYIAVHRNGRYHGGGSSDASGCLVLLVGVAVYCFWREILVIAAIVGTLALIGWLVWRFRGQLGRAAVAVCRIAWKGIRIAAIFTWRQTVRGYRFCTAKLTSRRPAPTPAGQKTPLMPLSASHHDDYGKIIQHKW